MIVKDLVEKFKLQVLAGEKGLDRSVEGGYCGDLLSDVMGNAQPGCVWLTIQGHQNIVAVAVLREMAAIILTGSNTPHEETREKAEEESIPLLQWSGSTYELAGLLYKAGVNG